MMRTLTPLRLSCATELPLNSFWLSNLPEFAGVVSPLLLAAQQVSSRQLLLCKVLHGTSRIELNVLTFQQDSLPIVEILVSSGANPNHVSEGTGETCLLASIARPHRLSRSDHGTARFLVSAGASVTAGNRINVTPLHAATASGDASLVEFLLVRGAKTANAFLAGARQDNGATALHEASFRGHLRIAQM